MSKDLTKEYKEAVMNDLPDLWSRIEAAIDAEESEKASETKEEVKVIPFVENKNNAVAEKTEAAGAMKYTANAYDNTAKEPVKAKKKKHIPSWVWVALPSVAVLFLVIIPITFLAVAGGFFASKSASLASDASPAAYAATDSVDYCDSAAVMAESDEIEYEDSNEGDSSQKNSNYAMKNNDYDIADFSDNTMGLVPTPGTSTKDENKDLWDYYVEGEKNPLVNDCVTVEFLSSVTGIDGKTVAEARVKNVTGNYSEAFLNSFTEFREGDLIFAYIPNDFDLEYNKEYDVLIRYVFDDEFWYEVEFLEED